jgi:5-(carboxyamino)imidazole ribonucleotide synthase
MRFSFLKQTGVNRYDQLRIDEGKRDIWIEKDGGDNINAPLYFRTPLGRIPYTVYWLTYHLVAFPVIWSAGRIAGIFFSEMQAAYTLFAFIIGLAEILCIITLLAFWKNGGYYLFWLLVAGFALAFGYCLLHRRAPIAPPLKMSATTLPARVMRASASKPTVVIPPGSTIGILGGGQLGQMLAMAATPMGYRTHIYCPDKDSPAFAVSTKHTCAAYDDTVALKKFSDAVDVITYEFENIPTAPLALLKDKLKPGIDVLAICQHRIHEKEMLKNLGVKTAPFAAVKSQAELVEAVKRRIGTPSILKTATMGYDGKGQWKITDNALPTIQDGEYILERFVDFTMEISVIVARGAEGETKCYVPVQNTHKNHILHETIAPAPIHEALANEAQAIARKIADGLNLIGILAVEMFVTKDGKLVVNELAPRPHNSGHWTIDACATSQFEQTVRAICGLELGSTERLCDARMLNLIGDDILDWEKYAAMPNARVYSYGKKESRPGRKMGHVTFLKN